MADMLSKSQRSRVMAKIKSRGSKIETFVADMLKKNGIRYRTHSRRLPGRPDFYFPKSKTVVFVDSCFWHGCRHHGSLPKTNRRFWTQKISGNKKRDREVNRTYKKMGWKAVRVWEHSLKLPRFEIRITRLLTSPGEHDTI